MRLHVTAEAAAGGRTRDVVAVHRRGGVDHERGRVTLAAGPDEPLVLTISARGQDYALTAARAGAAGSGGDGQVVAVVDGRELDTVATGGFVGLWLGVYGTSNGRPTSTSVTVHTVEYLLP
ncbi:hypothetical protein FHR80_002440 [Cellulomonas cellasea]|uniref:Beta-xylosidase C-terminal Concanavalin A-like domain-containing protein n=1 Tax=Cellulomonas cellasea TaxID=43670 RepID=A0A7W4YB49_9CELL|nr:hypothetical protein [Cellulomonas cellasea]